MGGGGNTVITVIAAELQRKEQRRRRDISPNNRKSINQSHVMEHVDRPLTSQ